MKPIIAERKDKGEVIGSLGATFGDLKIGFVRDSTGRIYISIFQENQSQARNVEVTLHKFFGGTVSETFYAEDFQQFEGAWCVEKFGFPADLFVGLADEKIKVSARFVD